MPCFTVLLRLFSPLLWTLNTAGKHPYAYMNIQFYSDTEKKYKKKNLDNKLINLINHEE